MIEMPIRERGDLWASEGPFKYGQYWRRFATEGDKTPYQIVYRVTQRFYFMGHNAILFDISLTIIMSLVWGTKLMVQFSIEHH